MTKHETLKPVCDQRRLFPILAFLAIPFILSRERNIKASAGLSVLMAVSYFAFIHICRLVGLPPILAAFLPILLFGTVAAVMLDSIKT